MQKPLFSNCMQSKHFLDGHGPTTPKKEMVLTKVSYLIASRDIKTEEKNFLEEASFEKSFYGSSKQSVLPKIRLSLQNSSFAYFHKTDFDSNCTLTEFRLRSDCKLTALQLH